LIYWKIFFDFTKIIVDTKDLIERAIQARKHAVAAYSHFQVGAIVVANSGKIFVGCNIENSSYGLTMCAERVAIFKALSEGEREFQYVVVAADLPIPCYPCGACRQIIWDFASHAKIICANIQGRFEIYTAAELIPHAFGAENLKK
jgi:cytidine deaminase